MKDMIPLIIAIPLLSAFLISLLSHWFKNIGKVLALLSVAGLFSIILYSVKTVSQTFVYPLGGWLPPVGICFVVDALTVFMLMTVNTIALAAILYSWSYLKQYTDEWKYYTLFMLMLAGMNGVIITGDLFNLYVFLEIAALSSYALVAFGCESEELEASFKYIVLGSVASAMILIGIGVLYSLTSTLNMADIVVSLPKDSNWSIKLVLALFIMGFGLKAALVPFHAWLPDAHPSAPAPISAMLSGVLIKALGVYTLCRLIFNVIGFTPAISNILLLLGTFSMIIGVMLAIYQWDFKRLLAYHSISQIGYVIIGIGLGTPLGIIGGLFHLLNHAIFKSLLFLNAGAVEYATDTRQLGKMGGLREKMPVTSGTSLVASMSIAGIPPFNGFWSKLIIIIACVAAGRIWLSIAAVFVSILTLASFLKVQKYAFWGNLGKVWENVKEVPFPMMLAMFILAALCLVSALLIFPYFSNLYLEPVGQVLMKGVEYSKAVFSNI